MRQHQVLLVADAQLVEGVALDDVGDGIHLLVAGIARYLADTLERDRQRGIVGMAVRDDVAPKPCVEPGIGLPGGRDTGPAFRTLGQRRRREIGFDGADVGFGKLEVGLLQRGEFGLYLPGQLFRSGLVDQDLDTRLVLVVAATMEVVHAQDGRAVGQEILLGQEVADLLRDHGRAALAAADIDGKAELALFALLQMQPNVVGLDRRAIVIGTGDRDLELARQEREFRMNRRPLAQDFRVGSRIGDLVGSGTREVVGRDVADAVAGGLDGVHLDRGKVVEDRRNVGQGRPVELDVLARGEVTVALVVGARDVSEHAKLARRQRAVRNRDPEHVGMKLQVDAVHQPQRLELVLRDLAGKATIDLIPELGDASLDEGVVELVVAVHRSFLRQRAARPDGPACRHRSGRSARRRGCAHAAGAGGWRRRQARCRPGPRRQPRS